MTLKEKAAALSQLRSLRCEVDLLSQRIAEMERKARGEPGRVSGLPAARWTPTGAEAEKLKAIAMKLEARRARCMDVLGALYDFIDAAPDSAVRQALTYRYVDGESWQRVAFRMGETDEQYPRRLHNRYLDRTDDTAFHPFTPERSGHPASFFMPKILRSGAVHGATPPSQSLPTLQKIRPPKAPSLRGSSARKSVQWTLFSEDRVGSPPSLSPKATEGVRILPIPPQL